MILPTANKAVLTSLWVLVAASIFQPSTADQRQLLWFDEFDTGNQPRSENWSYDLGNGGWGNGELQYYTDSKANVLVEDGNLKIIARKDDSTDPPSFSSARIKTEDKMSFKYGTVEARIKSPDVNAGLWPAFWTLGSNFKQVGWPGAGEVDIMEIGQGLANRAGLANKRVVSAAHWEYEGNYATYAKHYDSSSDLSQAFHVYRLEWTPHLMATFVDDAKIWEMAIDEGSCIDCEELHHPHFILLNMAVGGGFTSGSASSSGGSSSCAGSSSSSSSGGCESNPDDITAPFPGEMLVDWIRLYDNGFTEVNPLPTPQPTPTIAHAQTSAPTKTPTVKPTRVPTTPTPTASTNDPTPVLTPYPTKAPSSGYPTGSPSPRPTPFPTTTDTNSAVSPTTKPPSPRPSPFPTYMDTNVAVSPTTKPPSPRPTPFPTYMDTNSAVSPTTKPPTEAPKTSPPSRRPTLRPTWVRQNSFDSGDYGYDDDFHFGSSDCVSRSGSRSGGKSGKGGKGGKAGKGSTRTSGRSGGKAGKGSTRTSGRSGSNGKGGKGGKGHRRLSNSKGKGGSGSARSGCHSPGNARARESVETKQSSYLASHATVPVASSAAAQPVLTAIAVAAGALLLSFRM